MVVAVGLRQISAGKSGGKAVFNVVGVCVREVPETRVANEVPVRVMGEKTCGIVAKDQGDALVQGVVGAGGEVPGEVGGGGFIANGIVEVTIMVGVVSINHT